jgi:hypothetical protein
MKPRRIIIIIIIIIIRWPFGREKSLDSTLVNAHIIMTLQPKQCSSYRFLSAVAVISFLI